MMKTIIWPTVAFGLLAAVHVLAQAGADFTGTWIVEKVEHTDPPTGRRGSGGRRQRMGGGPGGMRGGAPPDGGRRGLMALPQEGQQVRIKQTADRLIVTTAGEAGEQMSAYGLDGSESTNVVGRGTAKSKTRWDGVALVTDSTHRVDGPMGEITLKVRDVRTLAEDGAAMTVRTTVDAPRGKMTTTVLYRRASGEK